MKCPREITQVVLELLSHGLLRIRAFAGAGESKKCFIEADHLHNLPSLLADYRPDMLRYYWQIERPSFISQMPADHRRDWEPFWDRLAPLVRAEGIETDVQRREH